MCIFNNPREYLFFSQFAFKRSTSTPQKQKLLPFSPICNKITFAGKHSLNNQTYAIFPNAPDKLSILFNFMLLSIDWKKIEIREITLFFALYDRHYHRNATCTDILDTNLILL